MKNVQVHINTGTSSKGLSLTFIDSASGLVILKTTLSHAELGQAVMGYTSNDRFDAQVLDDLPATWIGHQRHIFRRRFKPADHTIADAFRKGEIPAALDLWSDVVRSRCWAQTGSWSLNNQRVITFRMTRFENDLTEEKAAEVQACLNEHDAPEGLISL